MMPDSAEELIDRLETLHGRCYDFELGEEEFERLEPELHNAWRTIVTNRHPDADSYRDDRGRRSLHVTDYRGIERQDAISDIVVAHIENFNPEKHPVLHALVDLPLWFYRNRVKGYNRL